MTDQLPQSYATHRKIVPTYHFLTFGILFLNLLWAGYWLWRQFSNPAGKAALAAAAVALLVSVALLFLFFHARMMALTVQDRLIRLEEILRMERVLPPELRGRISELTRGQFVALRFAPDDELPELVKKVLDEKITDKEAIKKMIRRWRADHLRC